MAVTKKQADSLMKKAKGIQKTFDKVKGKMTQKEMNKAGASLSGAIAGVKNLNKSQNSSRVEKSIPAETIGTESPVIPPKPVPTDVGDMVGMNNASVLQQGLTLEGGQFVKDPNASDVMNATKEANANMGNIANQMLGYLQPQQDQMKNAYEDTYGISEKQAQRDLRRAEQQTQQYTSQLNNITSSRDASILALEDTGRGQTTGFIGGEQGRIQRQAAIAALPVQAQLAAAQGNLEIAKSHVDSLFQMKVKDIETEQAYKNTVANTWMSVANTQQTNLLNAAIADSNARAEAKKTAMNDAKQIAMQAIEYGQSSLAASVMKLDPTSKTYQQDVMNAMGSLRKPIVATTVKPDTQVIGDTLYERDPATGEWKVAIGGTSSGTQELQKVETANDIEKILQLTDATLGESLGKRNIIQRNIPGTQEYQFSVQHDNLINQLALAARGELKGQGQVSDYEGKLLKSAQTTLNLYMDPKEYRKEAKQVLGAINTSSGIPQQVKVTNKDGVSRYAVLGSTEIQEAVNQGYVIEYQ